MKKLLLSYFYFTKGEIRGIVILVLLSIFILLVPAIIKNINSSASENDLSGKNTEVQLLNTKSQQTELNVDNNKSKTRPINVKDLNKDQLVKMGINKRIASTIIKYKEKGGKFKDIDSFKKIYGISKPELSILSKAIVFKEKENIKTPFKLVDFDPNSVSLNELLNMGIRKEICQTMINFRSKGFRFKDKEDISKIYGINNTEIQQIKPFIKILDQNGINIKYQKIQKHELLEINTATIESLDKLKGVGPYWAGKLLKYRDALGGYRSVDQIKEIWGINDSLSIQIISQITCNGIIQKLKVNAISYEILSEHPYINGKQAKIMINYIKQHGSLTSVKDLESTFAFKVEELQKLEPYIQF